MYLWCTTVQIFVCMFQCCQSSIFVFHLGFLDLSMDLSILPVTSLWVTTNKISKRLPCLSALPVSMSGPKPLPRVPDKFHQAHSQTKMGRGLLLCQKQLHIIIITILLNKFLQHVKTLQVCFQNVKSSFTPHIKFLDSGLWCL